MTEIPRQTNVGQIPVPEISHSQSRVYTNAERYLHPIFTPKKLTMPSDSCSDLITFMDGTELKIRVEEITPEYVAYRRCDYLDGPLIKSATAEIFRIKYGTGMVRVFEHAQPPVNQQTTADYSQPSQKTNGWAVASFVSACFSFLLIPAFAAVIMGIIALVTVEKNPGKFKGNWMAVA